MRWKALIVGAVVLTTAACGMSDFDGSQPRTGRTFGTEVWYEATPGGSANEIQLHFDGAHGTGTDECAPERDVVVEPDKDEVRLTIRRFAPSPVMTCDTTPQTITATLAEPLGDRALTNPQTGWRFRHDGDRYTLDPDSTPCAQADCSAPSVPAASCAATDYIFVVNEQLRPPKTQDQDIRCDGTFLALTRDGRRAWFVNRNGGWKLVTNEESTCDGVFRRHRIHFAPAFCT